ncbi:hypothetical protein F2P81_019570 [Scophthalmus maximus]|uniref:Uncharacterized protein n=1 Tax=Scophthalmus maximus TaxID=52904 RepID=A0A6A4S2A5_SCOMX|nr:hypothetical protein F2P81_019570 [Scophthalmus maximus]
MAVIGSDGEDLRTQFSDLWDIYTSNTSTFGRTLSPAAVRPLSKGWKKRKRESMRYLELGKFKIPSRELYDVPFDRRDGGPISVRQRPEVFNHEPNRGSHERVSPVLQGRKATNIWSWCKLIGELLVHRDDLGDFSINIQNVLTGSVAAAAAGKGKQEVVSSPARRVEGAPVPPLARSDSLIRGKVFRKMSAATFCGHLRPHIAAPRYRVQGSVRTQVHF